MESHRGELITLIEHKTIAQKDIDEVVDLSKVKPTTDAWRAFFNHLFLWSGFIALGLSAIFFLAHNWSQIGRITKFAMVEFALVISTLGYLKTKIGSVSSKASLTLSCLLLGALMALFGQTYQTGADPWQLFFYWTLMMTPWAWVARFSAVWIMWLSLLNLSIVLYCDVHVNPLSTLFKTKADVMWLLFIFNTLSLCTWHKLSQSIIWLQRRWALRLIAIGSGFSITYLALLAIIHDKTTNSLALPVWTIFLFSLYYFYRKVQVDLFMLATACLSGIVVIITLLSKYIIRLNDSGTFLILSILVIAMGVSAAIWLKKVQEESTSC